MKGLLVAIAVGLAACSPAVAPADSPAGQPQAGLRQVPLTITSPPLTVHNRSATSRGTLIVKS